MTGPETGGEETRRLIQAASAEMRQHFQDALKAEHAVSDERWAGWKALDLASWRLAETRLTVIERTAAALAEAHHRDMERIYSERQASNATAAQARIQAEHAAATNRRATAIAIVTATISVLATISLHFIDALRH